jgi:hypothetical protein
MMNKYPKEGALGEFRNDSVIESNQDDPKTRRVIAKYINEEINVHWRNIKDESNMRMVLVFKLREYIDSRNIG